MDSIAKQIELAGRRALVRLFRLLRPVRSGAVTLPLDASGKKILMLRQDRIGDVLVSLPIIHAIKNKFPTARIDALFGENNFFVATNDPVFASRFVYRKDIVSIISIVRKLRRERYDFVIDFMDNVSASSTILVQAIGAACTIGIEKENAYAYDVAVPRLPQASVHIVDRLAELLRPFGIDPAQHDLSLIYSIPEKSIRRARDWMAEKNIHAPCIGINISVSGANKVWGEKKFAETICAIRAASPGAQVVLFCAPGEEPHAARLSAEVQAPVFPPGTFDEFAAGIQQCNALITVDTSAVHLAAAFHIPAVVLFVHDKPSLMPWIPYHSPHRAVVTTTSDIANISVDEVVRAFASLDAECRITTATQPVRA